MATFSASLACLLLLLGVTFTEGRSGPLRFLVLGDWGVDGDQSDQINVANAMARYAEGNRVDFIVSTGDNFYPDGVRSADDSQFDEKWRNIYNQPSLAKLSWYLTLGNHDHRGDNSREWYQVEFGLSEPRWELQNMSYGLKSKFDDFDAQFVLLDSESLRHDKNDPDTIVEFAESTFSQSSATWKVAVFHHPAYSCGRYTGSGTMRSLVLPILEGNGVNLVLNGHDHSLQHMTKENSNLEHVISGSGGKLYYCDTSCETIEELGVTSKFCEATPGYVAVTMEKDYFTCEFYNANNDVIYSFRKTKS